VVISPDSIGSCTSNYHTSTTTMAPLCNRVLLVPDVLVDNSLICILISLGQHFCNDGLLAPDGIIKLDIYLVYHFKTIIEIHRSLSIPKMFKTMNPLNFFMSPFGLLSFSVFLFYNLSCEID
jgi:hypothetical protein